MKCSLGFSDFLEEISSLSHSIVFLYLFALRKAFLSLLGILVSIHVGYLSFSLWPFASLLLIVLIVSQKSSSVNSAVVKFLPVSWSDTFLSRVNWPN